MSSLQLFLTPRYLFIFHFLLLFSFFFSSLLSQQCSSERIYQNIQIITPAPNSCTNNTIRIGAPISGYYEDLFYSQSYQMYNGWKMFIDWVNYERRGVLINETIYFFELISIEDHSSSPEVIDITNYLIDHYHVDFMFGPYSTPLTASSARITEAQNISLFSSGAPLPSVFQETNYVYGLLPAAVSYSEGAFRAFHTFGAKTIAVITDDDVTVCNNESSILYAELYNLTLSGFYSVNRSQEEEAYNQTIRDILLELKANNVETVFGCSFSSLCELVSFLPLPLSVDFFFSLSPTSSRPNSVLLTCLCSLRSFPTQKRSTTTPLVSC
jgi:hypothetical protein